MSYAPYFAELLAQLCVQALPRNPKNFDCEHVRVCKILGSNVYDSYVLQGMVVGRKAEGRYFPNLASNASSSPKSPSSPVPWTPNKVTPKALCSSRTPKNS